MWRRIVSTDAKVECDVLVFSDRVEARNFIVSLCADMDLRGLSGGGLIKSAAAEALTPILIYMNKPCSGIGYIRQTTAPPA